MIGKYKVGLIGIGTNKGIFKLKTTSRWNGLDELALYKSLERKPNESNIHFRNRLKNLEVCNSSTQGMINALTNAFDLEHKKVIEKKVFISTYKPISPIEYDKLIDPEYEYIAPKVIADDIEYQFIIEPKSINDITTSYLEGYDENNNAIKLGYDFEKVYVYKKNTFDICWTIWKNIDQSYTKIFQCSSAPTTSVTLSYMALNEVGKLIYVEESSTRLSRNEDDEIIYE